MYIVKSSNMHNSTYSDKFSSYLVHYCPLAVNLDKCVENCNTPNDFSNKVCVPNKTEDLNLRLFNMITGINESKTLPNHMSCKLNVNLMVENVIQIHVVAKMVNIWQVLLMIQ